MVVSIVSVVRNAKESISKTIESVLGQTYPDIEYIVMDGESTDGTIELLKQYENRLSRLNIEKDKGLYDAMNKALEIASGDFLIFMNSGDTFYHSTTIEGIVKYLKEKDTVFYGNVIMVNPETNAATFFGGKFGKHRLCFKNICHQAIFYPKPVYKQYKYDLKYRVFADYYYNISLIADKVKFKYMDEIVSYFELGGFSGNGDVQLAKDKGRIIYDKFGLYFYIYFVLKKNIRIRQLFRK